MNRTMSAIVGAALCALAGRAIANEDLDEVTVIGYVSGATVGGKQAQALREIPNSVSVLTRQRIEDQNLTTVADALTQVPGVTVISNDSTQSQYRSRGYNMGLMNDGIPAYSALSGYQQPDLAVYERVEVLRGPAGVLNGTGDPGGVVNMVQKRATEEFGLRASVTGGTWDNYRGTVDVTGGIAGRPARSRGRRLSGSRIFLARFVQRTRDGLRHAELGRHVLDDGRDLAAQAEGRDLRALRRIARAASGRGVAGRPALHERRAGMGAIPLGHERRERAGVAGTRRELDVARARGASRAAVLLQGRVFDDGRQRRRHSQLRAPRARLRLHPRFVGRLSERGLRARWAPARSAARLQPRRLQLRLRRRNVAPATPTAWAVGRNEADSEFTPYAGVVYDVTQKVSLYASYADVFIPQTQQRFDGSVIDSRVGKQYEVGAKAEFFERRLNAAIAAFNLRDTGRAFGDPAHPTFYINAGEVESKGWEIETVGSLWKGYEIQAGYIRLDTVYLRDAVNANLVFDTWEPRHTVKLWGVRRFEGGATNGLTVGVGGNYAARTRSGNGASAIRGQDSYVVVNAMVGYRFGEDMSLSLNLNNLLDETYYTRLGGVNTYNSYGEPFSASLAVSVKY